MTSPPLVLASGSAARAMLLRQAGLAFIQAPTDLDEAQVKRRLAQGCVPVSAWAQHLADAKADAAAAQGPKAWILAADQTLLLADRLFDKPADRDAARAQLVALRGQTHRLISASCLLAPDGTKSRACSDAVLTMRAFSDAFLEAYLDRAGTAVLSSVGGYQVEGIGVQLFERIEGEYFTILGLPLMAVLEQLRQAGLLQR